jgi:hypothetical protein
VPGLCSPPDLPDETHTTVAATSLIRGRVAYGTPTPVPPHKYAAMMCQPVMRTAVRVATIALLACAAPVAAQRDARHA